MAFNEDSRVKIPALLHLIRLGYNYIPRKEQIREEETNIFPAIFIRSLLKINKGITEEEIQRVLIELTLKLDYDDLGRAFYQELTKTSGIKLIDFENFERNEFHVTTELTCKNGDEEFRPDITLLINGIPLAFIEVKKSNNLDGVLAERNRINTRFQNKKFKRFANITQLMVFSNNMDYEDGVIEPIQGAYYATSAYSNLHFNYFREEENLNLTALLKAENEETENLILKDNHVNAIKHSAEFLTNKHYNTPTNKVLTSLFSKERLKFILKYAIAYVEDKTEGLNTLQKHIMRYPQIFATKAIENVLNKAVKKGIIWHTQGSGKTALAYYNVNFLTDYYQKRNTIAKFYFIVDRIDLADQSTSEFLKRGLTVNRVNSRQDFLNDIKKVSTIHNHSGNTEISVINIQKFTEDTTVPKDLAYDVKIQRIYFIDEAHRSYNPKGSFLVNLLKSDENAVRIALTGTPLLREVAKDFDSKVLFGDYIHKYYYNMSVADGYTLRLIREGIDTKYKMQMQDILEQIKIQQGDISKSDVFAHPKFAKPMLDYILNDLNNFRNKEQDDSLGAMVVCDTSKQAKELFNYFEELHGEQNLNELNIAAEPNEEYGKKKTDLKAALILHDINSKEDRKDFVKAFKAGEIDILFVFNMLLTGFDAHRLKKLYLARVVKDHNLLQTLTRVNRPYKKYRFGYVVDFAGISKAFKETNDNYFAELQSELGDEMSNYTNLFKSQEEISSEIQEIREAIFSYDIKNAELFQQQIEQIKSKKDLNELIKVLQNAKELKNIIRLQGFDDLLDKIDFFKLNQLLGITKAQLEKLNLIDAINNEADTTNLLNTALEDIFFQFIKVSEEELIIADQLRNHLKKTREALLNNFDQKDSAFISLKQELERIFKKKNLDEVGQEDMRENIYLLNSIYDRVTELNRKNNLLKAKYEYDEKYARIHKRITERADVSAKEIQLYDALYKIKQTADSQLLNNHNLLDNEAYFNRHLLNLVATEFVKNQKINLNFSTTQAINTLIASEYLNQYHNRI